MTDKSSEHHGPWSALDLVSVLGFCLLEFELCTLKATTGLVPVWALKKSQSRMPLRLNNAILVCSNYIPHTFNPCGDVTMSYPLWLALRNKILGAKRLHFVNVSREESEDEGAISSGLSGIVVGSISAG